MGNFPTKMSFHRKAKAHSNIKMPSKLFYSQLTLYSTTYHIIHILIYHLLQRNNVIAIQDVHQIIHYNVQIIQGSFKKKKNRNRIPILSLQYSLQKRIRIVGRLGINLYKQ